MEILKNPTITKANKDHRCDFCNEKIIKGEKYEKSTIINDGSIYDWKAHLRCSKLASRMDLYSDAGDDGVDMDLFMDSVEAYHYDFLLKKIPDGMMSYFEDFLHQIKRVKFRDKLWFVIKEFEKMDKDKVLI